jgi:hypothetical protein
VLLLDDLRNIMVKHPSASANPVTNQGKLSKLIEGELVLILLLFVKSRFSIIWLEGIFTERFLSKPNRVHLKYDKPYQLPYTRCSFTVCSLFKDKPVTVLDPR